MRSNQFRPSSTTIVWAMIATVVTIFAAVRYEAAEQLNAAYGVYGLEAEPSYWGHVAVVAMSVSAVLWWVGIGRLTRNLDIMAFFHAAHLGRLEHADSAVSYDVDFGVPGVVDDDSEAPYGASGLGYPDTKAPETEARAARSGSHQGR